MYIHREIRSRSPVNLFTASCNCPMHQKLPFSLVSIKIINIITHKIIYIFQVNVMIDYSIITHFTATKYIGRDSYTSPTWLLIELKNYSNMKFYLVFSVVKIVLLLHHQDRILNQIIKATQTCSHFTETGIILWTSHYSDAPFS